MSATATRPTGPVRAGGKRTGTARTGTAGTGTTKAGATKAGTTTGTTRTGVHRTGALRTGPRSVPVRPELRLVSPARSRAARAAGSRSRRAPFVLLVVALLAGTTLALLVLNTAIAVESLDATTLRQGNTAREQEVQRLERQVVDGSTPQSVAGDAARAGLVPAGTPAYLVVQPDGSSTLRGTPSPAPVAPLPPLPGSPPSPVPAPGAGPVPSPVPAPAPAPVPSPAPADAATDQAAGD